MSCNSCKWPQSISTAKVLFQGKSNLGAGEFRGSAEENRLLPTSTFLPLGFTWVGFSSHPAFRGREVSSLSLVFLSFVPLISCTAAAFLYICFNIKPSRITLPKWRGITQPTQLVLVSCAYITRIISIVARVLLTHGQHNTFDKDSICYPA